MALYKLSEEEKTLFFDIADFYVRIRRKLDGKPYVADHTIPNRQTKCELVGFGNPTSYYNSIDNPDLAYVALSPRSIDIFMSVFNKILFKSDVKAERHFSSVRTKFDKLCTLLDKKTSSNDFLVTDENSGLRTKPHKIVTPSFFKSFKDSLWHMYESFNGNVIRRNFYFEKAISDDTYRVKLDAYYKLHPWIGDARIKEDEQLVIITLAHSQTTREYNHILLETESRATEFDLSVGHVTFNSSKNNNIITKFVVLERVKADDLAVNSGNGGDVIPDYIHETFKKVSPPNLTLMHDLTIHDRDSLLGAIKSKIPNSSASNDKL